MVRFGIVLAVALLLTTPAWANRQTTCILIGDSIDSFVADGRASDLTPYLVAAERNVVIRNLSSPGATLGRADNTGFNNEAVIATMDGICGSFRYCDCVIITAGTNDFNNPAIQWMDVERSVTRILDWVAQTGRPTRVLMLDLIWRSNFEDGAVNHMGMTWRQFREARAALCTERPRVCAYAPRPTAFDAARPELFGMDEQSSGALLHPNAAGHRLRANWMIAAAEGAGLF